MTVPLHILGHVLTVCITLAIGMSLGLFAPSARVVEIDSETVLRSFVEDLGDLEAREIEARSNQFITTMQDVLDRYARANGVLVVESRLSVAGAEDISAQAYRQAKAQMEQQTGGLK